MYHLGSPAFSDFRIQKLLNLAQSVQPGLMRLESYHLYFTDLQSEFSDTDLSKLQQLLPGVTAQYPVIDTTRPHLIIVPRPGTISPWSSKATDIAQVCGLSQVKRVERGTLWYVDSKTDMNQDILLAVASMLYDRMTEAVFFDMHAATKALFKSDTQPRPLRTVSILEQGKTALTEANQTLGLALSDEEMDYLVNNFTAMQRNPSDAELMMFAQANSEHCRHKIFNADWIIDGTPQTQSLFQMIRHTHAAHPGNVLSAYHDNAAVMAGFPAARFTVSPDTRRYSYHTENTDVLMKVETHNHPTAISPFPGAATGSGGEIRDEGATGRGAKPKAGLTGFSVSQLRIPTLPRPWESDYGTPERLASALQIMLEGPIGASSFNNEFGRPALCGYFRSFEHTISPPYQGGTESDSNNGKQHISPPYKGGVGGGLNNGKQHISPPYKGGVGGGSNNGKRRGYHKPIMIAGGVGNIAPQHIQKQPIPPGSPLVVLGGPAMLIGLGGGAASSLAAGHSSAELDFASVQRGNPEMQRRCQEVIDACWCLGEHNPILSIHDVGAGGLSNAFPELVNDSGRGATFDLRRIPCADPGLSPMEIWCNESQERYVLAVAQTHLAQFEQFCQRERCPYAIVGEATETRQLQLWDGTVAVIDMPMEVLLGKPPKMVREVGRV